jgi:hypothetical protein
MKMCIIIISLGPVGHHPSGVHTSSCIIELTLPLQTPEPVDNIPKISCTSKQGVLRRKKLQWDACQEVKTFPFHLKPCCCQAERGPLYP